MIYYLYHRTLIIIFFLLMLIMMGCGSTAPTRFYTLSPISSLKTSPQAMALNPDLSIGIGPIEVPDYMDRPQIVTRSDKYELKIGEFNRWASPVKNDILRVIAQNLSDLLSTDSIYMYPWKQSVPIKYQVAPEIIRFDGELGGNVMLKADWSIYKSDVKDALFRKVSIVNKKIKGNDYNALVAAKSQALGDLSREIADAINTISREGSDQ